MKIFILALFVTIQAEAATKVLCSGKHDSLSVVINASIDNLTDIKSGKGSVAVDGRVVAEFEGVDAKVNYIFLSFKAKNPRGELLEGKVTDLGNKSGFITRLNVPGFGIDFKNIAMACVESRL